MKSQTIRRWSFIHTWSSLVCTLFLLLLALTGLPLIFHHELEHLLGDAPELREMPADTPHLDLQQLVVKAEQHRPGEVMQYFGYDEDERNGVVAITAATAGTEPNSSHTFMLDARTGEAVAMPAANGGFMMIMLRLHVDMFAGLPGKLLLAFMGLLFVIAIVSGVVLYLPFMRRLKFGALRTQRSTRVRWLDWHNLLGIVTVVWLLVVGITGSINTLNRVVLSLWQMDQMAEMTAPFRGLPPVTQPAHLEDSIRTARAAVPDMAVSLVAFPGTMFSSPHHYTFFMKGNTPVTSRLLKPALVDATNGELTDPREMPWYVKTLFLSQPLHFGDYGGLPLKILWAVLDLFAIVVLGSGLYLWLRKPKAATAAKPLAEDAAETANALRQSDRQEAAQ